MQKDTIKKALLSAGFTLLLGGLVCARLGALPGLNLDEAWVGLRALDIQKAGLFTPHGMNWYTGPFHTLLVSKIFGVFGANVFSLRLAGAVLNVSAAGIMALFVALAFGFESFFVFAALMLASPFYIFESRIAWEVCALQNILAAVSLIAAWQIAKQGRAGLLSLLALFYASAVGSLNHLIFMAFPFGLAFGFFAWQAESGSRRFGNLTVAAAANVVCALTLLIAKKHLSDSFWLPQKLPVTALFMGLPALAALSVWRWQEGYGKAANALANRLHSSDKSRKALRYFTIAGLLACLWFHATAFMGTFSGYNVFKRLFSLDLGLVAATALFIWAAIITGAVFSAAFGALENGEESDGRLFTAIALVGMAAVFTIFRNTNSLRYYILPFFVFVLAAAVFLPDYLRRSGGKTRAFLALCAAAALLMSCSEIIAPKQRRPFHFLQGWHDETSARMMDIAWLAKKLENEKTCGFAGDAFITMPLEFMYKTQPWQCGPGRSFTAGYCYECETAPYIRGYSADR